MINPFKLDKKALSSVMPLRLTAGSLVTHDGRVNKIQLDVSKLSSLTHLFNDFVIFTPALCFLYGAASDALLLQLFYEINKEIEFYYMLFDKELFIGLETPDGDKTWNRGLWAVNKENWNEFTDFWTSTGIVDKARLFRCSYLRQEVNIVDPLSHSNQLLKIFAYAVTGSMGTLYFSDSVPPVVNYSKLEYGKDFFVEGIKDV